MSTEDTSPTAPRESSSDDFQTFLTEYLARIERDGTAAIDEFRARHPEFASQLGHQLEWLANHLWHKKESMPERIGSFRVMQRLGTGGMGEVFLAEQTTPFKRVVAVKVIRLGKNDEARVQRFANEAQLLASLNHDRIARVYDAGVDRGMPWFSMEYVPGKSLTAYCADERLGVEARLRLFLEICKAVEYAHQQGILHRDLKPSNILVYGPRSQPVVKVIDFGLAKLIEPDPTLDRITQTAQVVGTPDYMSPEQVDAASRVSVDTRTDVYALGVVLYELLTGALPLHLSKMGVKDLKEMVRTIREREPSSPSIRVEEPDSSSETSPMTCAGISPHALSRQLAGDLDSIVMKALAKDADRRYGSVARLADDLWHYLRQEPVSSRKATRLYVLHKFLRRHRLGASFVITLATLTLGSLVTINIYALENVRNLERGNMFGLAGYLEELRAQDAVPLPPYAEHQEARTAWMHQFEMLLLQSDRMRSFLAVPAIAGGDPTTPEGWANGGYSDHILRDAIQRTLTVMAKMTEPGAEVEKMRLRMQWATSVREATVEDHAADWARVRAEIAEDTRFANLDLRPQTGLVPLGKNEFGLQEFALLLPGAGMPRLEGGRHVIDDLTCPIFVLLPGGDRVLLGSQKERVDGDHYDPEREVFEQDLREVRLEPFFASKYEFTNGQWGLLNPGPNTRRSDSELFAARHPLVGVNDASIEHVAGAWGMRLPGSDEWEYLARGDTHTSRWCGDKTDSLQTAENVYDESLVGKPDLRGEGEAVGWSDGYPVSAAVGSLKPNGFGLYDVLGNVKEVAVGEGKDESTLELRGSSWHAGAKAARSTARIGWYGNPLPSVGFRPVISVQK